jgi:hypothetical protein
MPYYTPFGGSRAHNPFSTNLGVRDGHEGRGVAQDTLVHAVQRLGIEGRKTFVQNEDGGTLQQRAGNIESAALARS